jgi:hypothetical protein
MANNEVLGMKRMIVLTAALTLAACDNAILKSWYDDPGAPAAQAAQDAGLPSGDCELLLYYFESPAAVGVITGRGDGSEGSPIVITITYPYGAAISDDTETLVVSTGAVAVPVGSWQTVDGGHERTYTVTAPDGAAKRYLVRATAGAGAGDCEILAYYFAAPVAVGTITEQGTGSEGDPIVITIMYPADASIPDDTFIKTVSIGGTAEADGGWTEDAAGGSVRAYTVTAQNGATKHYRVTATADAPVLPSDCDLLLYYFENPVAVGKLTEGGDGSEGSPFEITITYPYGTAIPGDALIKAINTGKGIEWEPWIGDAVSGFVRTYTVTAQNDTSKKRYCVRATRGEPVLSGDCEIKAYFFVDPVAVGVIGTGTGSDAASAIPITLTNPYGASAPPVKTETVVHTGSLDESSPWTLDGSAWKRLYTVTAQNGATKYYRVTAEKGADAGALQKWLDGVKADVARNGGDAYAYTITDDEALIHNDLVYDGKTVTITLTGGPAEKKVRLEGTGSLFTIGANVTLTLDRNVTLQGRGQLQDPAIYNTAPLVMVQSGGNLVVEKDSKITGNTNNGSGSGDGGGVYVDGGNFTMNGGEISGNTSGAGGGVYVNGGMFTMNSGKISNNIVSGSGSGAGGGVHISGNGMFSMSGGTISGNTATTRGGGVAVESGSFIKNGNSIIYGDTDTNHTPGSDENTATSGNGNGHAVSFGMPVSKKRDATASATDSMNSSLSGSQGGWE